MPQLIDPFDREVRRARRNDGFSDDGLSYSVANDFGKLWGQAMAEYDARTAKPRSDVFGQTLQEDTPQALQHQLLDPLTQHFGAPTQTHNTPRTYKFGNKLVSVDPMTGNAHEVFSTPEKPDQRGDSFEQKLILNQISDLRKLKDDRINLALSKKTAKDIDDEIKALEDKGRQIYHPAATASPVMAAPPLNPRGIIGSETNNQFQLPPQAVHQAAPSTTKVWKRNAAGKLELSN